MGRGKVRTGKATRWNAERGFGFIQPDDGDADVFVHRSALGESRDLQLEEGDRVEFEDVFDERKGKSCAGNVVVVGGGGGGGGSRGGRDRGRGRDDSRDRRPRSPPRRGRGRDDSRDRGRSRSRGR
mmetsp:Transcript_14358/g.30133  ORF Transcript_14358/g.30133 Transcript_14358/m.30133 type:complete len:126 (-) Transcript_14358:64-441(-)